MATGIKADIWRSRKGDEYHVTIYWPGVTFPDYQVSHRVIKQRTFARHFPGVTLKPDGSTTIRLEAGDGGE